MPVVDLSTLASPADSTESVYDNLTDEQKADLHAKAEELGVDVEPALQVRTAFLVIVQENGEVVASPDLSLRLQRTYIPTADDVYGACAVTLKDLTVQDASQATAIGMQQMAAHAQKRMQDARIAQQLNLPQH